MTGGGTMRAEIGALEILPGGEAFAMVLVTADGAPLRIELPVWSMHQLMRLLPRLDAAMLQARDAGAHELVAHPAAQWSVGPLGPDVALSVQTDQHVAAAYLFEHADAVDLHAALGDAIARGDAACAQAVATPWAATAR